MAEETLRYRVEIDEPSLQSELARTRASITNVLQNGLMTSGYAVNALSSDIAMARQSLSLPASPMSASPAMQMGFFGASMALSGMPTPPNMLTQDMQRMAQFEIESRVTQATIGLGRQALPLALGALGSRFGVAGGLVGYGIGEATQALVTRDMEARSGVEETLFLTRSPNPMAPFTRGEQRELAGGLMRDIANDTRFGVKDLNQLLAGGMEAGQFNGVQGVEEFRQRFRTMLEQVRTITRVMGESTQEAMQTLGQLNQMGVAGPGVMDQRLSGVLALSRMTGMGTQAAMGIGGVGAAQAQQRGLSMGAGFDAMIQQGMLAQTAATIQTVDPTAFRQLGGVQGVAGLMSQVGFAAAGAQPMQQLLAGFSNDTMTGIDQAKVRQFLSGQLNVQDVQGMALDRLSDPAQRLRFAANQDQLQGQLAQTGLAGAALFKFAQFRADLQGARAEDVFGQMLGQMGLNPMERQAAIAMTRDQARLEAVSDRRREMADFEIQAERTREEGRFSTRIAREVEGLRVSFSENVGEPLRQAGRAVGGFFEGVAALPGRALNWVDMSLGKLVFGGAGPQTEEQSLRTMNVANGREISTTFRDSVKSLASKVDFSDIKLEGKLNADEKAFFEEAALGTFAGEIQDLANEPDPSKRAEKRNKLQDKMSGWVRANFGHLMGDEAAESKQFADKLLSLEKRSAKDDGIRKGLSAVVNSTNALQMREYVGDELPGALMKAAGKGMDKDRLLGITNRVAASYKGDPQMAAYEAIQTLGEDAVPMLAEGSEVRSRLEVASMFVKSGFLRPGDLEVDQKELATVREQATSAGQIRFVDELQKQIQETEGHKLSADQLFRSVGMGLGGTMASNTPGPATGVDSSKWDLAGQTLDKLTGSVDRLSMAANQLLDNAKEQGRRQAGKP
jgi:hypothetical protein